MITLIVLPYTYGYIKAFGNNNNNTNKRNIMHSIFILNRKSFKKYVCNPQYIRRDQVNEQETQLTDRAQSWK